MSAALSAGPLTSPPVTPREAEVLFLMAAGLQNKEIAGRLGLSAATVRNHVHSILVKLGVVSRVAAVSVSFRNGWIPSTPGSSDPLIPDRASSRVSAGRRRPRRG